MHTLEVEQRHFTETKYVLYNCYKYVLVVKVFVFSLVFIVIVSITRNRVTLNQHTETCIFTLINYIHTSKQNCKSMAN